MPGDELVPIAGSEHPPARVVGPTTPDDSADPIRLRLAVRPSDFPAGKPATSDHEEVAAVERFARARGFDVVDVSPDRRVVEVEAPPPVVAKAFDVKLVRTAHGERRYRRRAGPIHVPKELSGVVTGVFGLDTAPVRARKPRVARARAGSGRPTIDTAYLTDRYRFPNTTGAGQRVALIEMSGGYRLDDLQRFCAPGPVPSISDVCVGGGGNRPDPIDDVAALLRWMRKVAGGDEPSSGPPPPGSDTYEVTMDIELVAAFAPDAEIFVYFTDDTEMGLLDAFEQVLDPAGVRPSVVSVSWSWSERGCQLEGRLNEHLRDAVATGVTVCCASGDFGSQGPPEDGDDGSALHPQFPPTSPYVLACGGTMIDFSGPGAGSEVVWQTDVGMSSGGGISTHLARPDWQGTHDVPPASGGFVGRGIPDVAAVADPSSLIDVVAGGERGPASGTSAAAPLWAALVARLNEALGTPVGYLNPVLYSMAERGHVVTTDVVHGTNGAYRARPGWDACTGLGVPNGHDILDALRR